MSAIGDLHVSNRHWIVETLGGLDDAGWHASTLCEGWEAEDLTAHLVARERHQFAAAGLVVPALRSFHERAMAREKARGRAALVERLAAGPPLGRLMDWANGLEFWIHAEDLARGSLEIERPPPEGAAARVLWTILARNARLSLRRVRTAGVVAIDDTEAVRSVAFRLGGALPRKADPALADVTLSGQVGELTLWLSGRRGAADVVLSPADHPLAEDLRRAPLGF